MNQDPMDAEHATLPVYEKEHMVSFLKNICEDKHPEKPSIERVYCLMCLFDSAGRDGITPEEIFTAFALKLEENKKRTWVKNPDNTYSHIKFG